MKNKDETINELFREFLLDNRKLIKENPIEYFELANIYVADKLKELEILENSHKAERQSEADIG